MLFVYDNTTYLQCSKNLRGEERDGDVRKKMRWRGKSCTEILKIEQLLKEETYE